jgi:glycine hydroxymethyltransferase
MTHKDFLFRGELAELDPDVADLIRHETARQAQTLIMIPSESTIPAAVREALSSAFHNIYAEGYPLDETRTMTQASQSSAASPTTVTTKAQNTPTS